MPTRMTLPLILGLLVLPVFPQNEPPPITGATGEVSGSIADLMSKAEQGDADAQFNLGFMYFLGEAIPLDYKEAFRWYRASAVQGKSSAQGSLGAMYRAGLGLPQDYIQAHMWYNLAVANSELDQERNIWAKNRDATAKKMTSEQLAEAQRLAREWKPKTGSQ
ncbi:MAG: tetratricopeptide repeat protein [Acidobacteria bacterium]|nr:tetratricopeptide repeat protein [Acidobacteriota bacterium]